MQIGEWSMGGAAEAELREWYDVFIPGYIADRPGEAVPPMQTVVGWFSGGPAFRERRFWQARDDVDRLVGTAWLTRSTIGSNQHRANIDGIVPAEHRRRGVGTALLTTAARAAAAAGCTAIGLETADTAEADGFLGRFGARRCLAETRSILHVADVDRADVKACAGRPADAAAYSLVSWDGHIPDEWLERYAAISSSMNDAPRGDLSVNDELPNVDRIRGWRDAIIGRGDAPYAVCARHDPTGELAGLTELIVHANGWPSHAWQEDTVVDPRHRGHGLGLWIKAAMLDRLLRDRPDLERIETWNAEDNVHMLAINRRLGFRPVDTQLEWELETAHALRAPAPS
ncbi:MAG TPA: GNAT family protein [Mycobacteriales bacterium]|jgi:GNAT superfamily N-acetyltransferase|nr:GNAT family protein [Mycobacteriales bacterium]